MADPEIAQEDFLQFYLAKSYDVIGRRGRSGSICASAGRPGTPDPWAVEMNAGVTKVRQAVRGLQALVVHIPKQCNTILPQLCRDVMVRAQPPNRRRSVCKQATPPAA